MSEDFPKKIPTRMEIFQYECSDGQTFFDQSMALAHECGLKIKKEKEISDKRRDSKPS